MMGGYYGFSTGELELVPAALVQSIRVFWEEEKI